MPGKSHGEKRSRLQEATIAALLECQTIGQAAARVGVDERTIRNWKKIPEFQAAYAAARRECVDGAVSRLQKGFEFAVAVLQKVAGNESAPYYARVAAAKNLIDSGFKAAELCDVMSRISELEQRVNARDVERAETLASLRLRG